MPVRFQCTHCLSHLTVSKRFSGKRGRCPSCKSKVLVPEINIGDPLDEESSPPDSMESDTFNAQDPESPVAASSGGIKSRSGGRLSGVSGEKILVTRWVVYVQGALLGIIATTFFVFGLAVGNSTSSGSLGASSSSECVVTGSIYYDQGQERRPDTGAVVILLPTDTQPRTRPDAAGLRPTDFEPINNEAMESIRALGGSIVRADQDGNFQTDLKNNKSYWLLVISRNRRADNDSIGKQTRAEIGSYFLPIETLLGDRAFMWHKIRIAGSNRKLQGVTF